MTKMSPNFNLLKNLQPKMVSYLKYGQKNLIDFCQANMTFKIL
jgi:hypothetical protein